MSKGVSALVSAVVMVALVIAVVGIALNYGMPIIERMQDTAAIERNIDSLQTIDSLIQEVLGEGEYSARTMRLSFDRGYYGFDNDTGELYYRLDTTSRRISTHSSQSIGAILLSANAKVEVYESSVDGVECYMMENQYLKACVRDLNEGFNASEKPSFKGFWMLDEEEGQWANDSAGDNDGVLGSSDISESGDPDWISGVHGSALDFDGSDDYVEVESSSSLNLTGPITVSFWVKREETGEYHYPLAKHSTEGGYRLFFRSNDEAAFEAEGVTTAQSDNAPSTSTTFTEGEWRHLTAVYNGSHIRIFVDGEEDTTEPVTGGGLEKTPSKLTIGQDSDGNYHMNGSMDDIRIYNRSLAAEEVKWLYLKEGREQYINTSELLVYYRNKELGEELDGSVTVKANSQDGTITGTGHTEAERTGQDLGRGRVTATVNSDYGLVYDIHFDLLSGSDFLKIDASER